MHPFAWMEIKQAALGRVSFLLLCEQFPHKTTSKWHNSTVYCSNIREVSIFANFAIAGQIHEFKNPAKIIIMIALLKKKKN